MGTQIVSFDAVGKNLPSFLRTATPDADTSALASLLAGSIAVLSISGKVFTVVRGQEKKALMRPDDPETPAAYVDLVVIRSNTHFTKTFYLKAYDEGSKDDKPDCYSTDGVNPDAGSGSIQAKSCAACPHNVFGSKGKGKACQDNLRMAVATAAQVNEPLLLRLPPTSFKPFGEAALQVKNRGGAIDRAVMRFKFDPESETPRLLVRPLGWVTEDVFAEIQAMRNDPQVLSILSVSAPQTVVPRVDKAEDEDEDEDEAPAKPAKKAKPVVVDEDEDEAPPPKAAKPKLVVPDEDEDEAPAKPAKKAKPVVVDEDEDEAPAKPIKKAKPVVSDDSKASAAALLSKLSASAGDEDDD